MIKSGAPQGPTQRQKRVAEEVRHILATALTRGDFYDEVLTRHTVTITRVSVSPDLKQAKAFISLLGGGDAAPALEALKAHQSFFRQAVARSLTIKFTPRIVFALDDSLQRSIALEALFHSPKVAQDLGSEPEEDQ